MSQQVNAPGPHGAASGWAGGHPRLVDVAVAVLLAALVMPASLQVIGSATVSSAGRLAAYAAVATLQLAVVFRRQRPLTAYGTGCAAMLALTLLPYLVDENGQTVPGPFLPSALMFFVLLYSVAEQRSARVAAIALGAALLGGVIVLVRLAQDQIWWLEMTTRSATGAWLLMIAVILAGSLGAYSLGRLRRTRAAYLDELQERARRTEADRVREAAEAAEAERRRIARDMHDVVAHSLAVMISQAEGGRMGSQSGPSAAVFGTIADTGRAAMADMRAMLGVLRDPPSAAPALRAPQPGLADLPQLMAQVRSAGCPVQLTQTGTPVSLPASTQLTLYRLLQESLTNVVKHAGAGASAQVLLHWESDRLSVEVSDNGQSQPQECVAVGSTGLIGMRERVTSSGGTLLAGPAEASGGSWRVTATLPVLTEPRRR